MDIIVIYDFLSECFGLIFKNEARNFYVYLRKKLTFKNFRREKRAEVFSSALYNKLNYNNLYSKEFGMSSLIIKTKKINDTTQMINISPLLIIQKMQKKGPPQLHLF